MHKFVHSLHLLPDYVWAANQRLWWDCTFRQASLCHGSWLPYAICIKISWPDMVHVFSWRKVQKLFSCSTQLSMEIFMLINVKMPTIVGILAFISLISTTSFWDVESKLSLFFSIIVFMSFMLSGVEHEKKLYYLMAWNPILSRTVCLSSNTTSKWVPYTVL